jgi:signal transduction histidine kinase
VDHVAGPRQLRRLLDGVLAIGSDLDLSSVLHTIIATARDLVAADYGALGVLNEERTLLADFLTVGIDDERRAAIGHLPEGHGILGLLIHDPKPLRLPDLHEHPLSAGFPPHHPKMTSFLGVPIIVRGEVFGNLYLCDKAGGDVFTDVDEELAVNLATAAAIAIDNARLHARVAEMATAEDRDRIARDLHDTVIQRLFGVGLRLQATLPMITSAAAQQRVQSAIDDLDVTVRDVRTAIFELHSRHATAGRSVLQELLELAADSARALGFDPIVRFDGPIDTMVDDHLADEMFAVVREALTNVARHAEATRVELSVIADGATLTLTVHDDGVGMRSAADGRRAGGRGGRGLLNMRTRAEQRGGRLEVGAGKPRGTALTWTVPLSRR